MAWLLIPHVETMPTYKA